MPTKQKDHSSQEDTGRTGLPERLHLTSVRLERFKAAYKPKPIVLQPFTVLIGRNGSGKSTVLEALQWVDTAFRTDVPGACQRYGSLEHLVNLRYSKGPLAFSISLTWNAAKPSLPGLRYDVTVHQATLPEVKTERVVVLTRPQEVLVDSDLRGVRRIRQADDGSLIPMNNPQRLALAGARLIGKGWSLAASVQDYWIRAVFLRLSPGRLAQPSLPHRRYSDPLLDEEGQNLPALLNELTPEQMQNLAASIQDILPRIRGLEMSGPTGGREQQIYYSLRERMPYKGRHGRFEFPIPSWMLSEGTRRITAILALLEHDPPPSLLCIEEVENGLDPWAVIQLLQKLQCAATLGAQVVLTTHSPWLLNHVGYDEILHVQRSEGETVYERFADTNAVKKFAALQELPPGVVYANEDR